MPVLPGGINVATLGLTPNRPTQKLKASGNTAHPAGTTRFAGNIDSKNTSNVVFESLGIGALLLKGGALALGLMKCAGIVLAIGVAAAIGLSLFCGYKCCSALGNLMPWNWGKGGE